MRPISSNMLRISVNLWADKKFDLQLKPGDKISMIADAVYQNTGYPRMVQELNKDKQPLDFNKTLLECGVKDGDSIKFLFKGTVFSLTIPYPPPP